MAEGFRHGHIAKRVLLPGIDTLDLRLLKWERSPTLQREKEDENEGQTRAHGPLPHHATYSPCRINVTDTVGVDTEKLEVSDD